jgi:hypothetical protein
MFTTQQDATHKDYGVLFIDNSYEHGSSGEF